MANLSLGINPDSVRCGTTNGTCPRCQHSGDMEWWANTKRFRFLGIPTPMNSVDEILKCTVCGEAHAPH